ncbi:MAG: hypothetical protein ABIO70_29220 [Pseudomonadota bacterium]
MHSLALTLLLAACGPPDPLAAVAEVLPDPAVVADLRGAIPAAGLALVATPDAAHLAPLGSFEGFAEAPRAVLERVDSFPLVDGAFAESDLRGMMAKPLFDALCARADAWKAAAGLDPDLGEFEGELWLLTDRRLEYEPVRTLLYSAGQAQFGSFQLVPFGATSPREVEVLDEVDEARTALAAAATPTTRPDPAVGRREGVLRLRYPPLPGEPEVAATFEVDDRGATFTISMPSRGEISPVLAADPRAMEALLRADPDDPQLFPSYAAARQAAAFPVLPSLEILLALSKAADDRMMAALERARAPQRAGWIEAAARALPPEAGEGRVVLGAAALLGGQDTAAWGLTAAELEAARTRAAAFLAQPHRAKPLGIYAEDPDLAAIFTRDRFLLTPLDMGQPDERAVALALHALLRGEPALAASLREELALRSALDNPPKGPGVLDLDPSVLPAEVSLLPAATSRETELMERLGGTAMLGPHTMETFMAAVRERQVSLAPRPDSGWYDLQQWALEPLLTLPEAPVLAADAGYRRRLERAFEAAVASRRETHIKSLALPTIGAAFSERVPVTVAPDLRVEPLPTHYARSAESYDFLFGRALTQVPGWEAWDGGAVATDLAEARRRYAEAADIARADLGLETQGPVDDTAAWLARWWEDERLARDVRFMIPFGEDAAGRTLAWAVLGVTDVDVTVAYDHPPAVRALTPGYELEVTFAAARYTLPVLVFAELPVAHILDRAAFRALADAHPTQRELIRALEGP